MYGIGVKGRDIFQPKTYANRAGKKRKEIKRKKQRRSGEKRRKKEKGRKKRLVQNPSKNKYLQYYSPSSTVRNPPPTPPESDPNSDN